MTSKDLISKHLVKRIALDMARLLLHLDVDNVELVETQHQRVEERRADLMAKAYGPEGAFLLHLEIQNANDPAMPWRMLRYRTDLGLTQPDWPIRQYLLYIGPRASTVAAGLEQDGLSYRYTVIDMHRQSVDKLLEQDTPDALVLAILGDFGEQPPADVVRYILTRLLKLTGDNEGRFRDYLMMLEALATNRNLQAVVQEEATMLSQLRYSDLPSYHLGMKQGLQDGMQKGMQQGRQQGMQQGMQQGEARLLLRLLENKFGELPKAMRQRIESADTETLLAWSDRVLNADSLEKVLS